MKKTIYLLSLLLITTLVACNSKEKSEEGAEAEKMENLVDNKDIAAKILSLDNPLMTFTINVKNLLDKSNIQNIDISDEISMGMMLVNDYIGEDNKLGINWNQNIAITIDAASFEEMQKAEVIGFLKVDDIDKVKTALEQDAQADINEKDGVMIAQIDPTSIIAIKDHTLGVYFTGNRDVDGLSKIVAVMNTTAESENEYLNEFLAKGKDLSMFYFMGNAMKGISVPDSVQQKLDEIVNFDEVYSEVETNFENGKIVTTSIGHNYSEEFKSYMAVEGGLDQSLAKTTTTKGEAAIQAMYSFNLNKFLSTLINYVPEKSLAEAKMNLGAMGLSLDDLKNTFSGQFAFAMTNLPKKSSKEFNPDSGDFESRNDGNYGKFAVAANVTDAKAIHTLFENAPNTTKKGDYYVMIDEQDTMFYLVKDSRFIATSDKRVLDYNIQGELVDLKDAEYKSMANGSNMFAFKLDGKLFANMPIAEGDQAAEMFLGKLKKIVGMGTFDNAKFEVVVDNDSMNVLEYLVRSVVEAQKAGYLN